MNPFFLQNKLNSRYIAMIVINPNNTVFTFSIIPKTYIGSLLMDSFDDYTISITDEQKNKVLGTFNASNVQNNNDITNLTFTVLNTFYNDGFFTVEFKLFNELVFKDKVFATVQNTELYSINSGKYQLPNIQNNDYIII